MTGSFGVSLGLALSWHHTEAKGVSGDEADCLHFPLSHHFPSMELLFGCLWRRPRP